MHLEVHFWNKMRKKWTLFLTACIMGCSSILAQTTGIMINGKPVETKAAPVQKAGTVLVPLRVIENLDAKVVWDSKNKKIIITKADKKVELVIGSKKAVVNGKETEIVRAPEMINGTCMVPVRFIADQLDTAIAWNSKTQQVIITTKNAEEKPADQPSQQETVIKDKEAVALVKAAYDREVYLLTKGYDMKNPGNIEGYNRLVERFNTADKITEYLKKSFAKSYAENFIKSLGDRYKEVDGESYFVLGDVGVVPEFNRAVVKDKKEKDGKSIVTLEVPDEGEKATYKATIIKEDGEWKLEALDLIDAKGKANNALF